MVLDLFEAEKLIHQKTSGQRVVVFAKSYCPFCVKTKTLLQSKAVPFEYYELDKSLSESLFD